MTVSQRNFSPDSLVVAPDDDNMIELIAAEGNIMKVTGTTTLELQLPRGGWTTTMALVCRKLSHEMLLSWITQKELNMIHKGWPFIVIKC